MQLNAETNLSILTDDKNSLQRHFGKTFSDIASLYGTFLYIYPLIISLDTTRLVLYVLASGQTVNDLTKVSGQVIQDGHSVETQERQSRCDVRRWDRIGVMVVGYCGS